MPIIKLATFLLHFPISEHEKIPELLIKSAFFGDYFDSERGYRIRFAMIG